MPGSTAASSSEQTKAKVTESSGTNGIFVRPVAVAGIFRPAEESANKPPALPEKRRFSTLSGDLRPCSGISNDDFTRRRQSWDTKPKEAPFGPALLRKTPRNSNASSSSQELATNGSHKDDSCSELTQSEASVKKSVENLSSKSETSQSNNISNSNLISSSKEKAPVIESTKLKKTQLVFQVNKDEKVSNASDSKNQKCISNEISSVVSVKNATDSVIVNSTYKISVSEKSTSNNSLSSEVDKTSISIDNFKQPKKVFGLIKRDTKSETISQKLEHSVPSGSKPNIDTVKNEKCVVKKESQFENLSKSENLPEKAAVSTADVSKNKKVFGVNKTNLKKEVKETSAIKSQEETNLACKPAENVANNKLTGNAVIIKPSECKILSKSVESNIESKISDAKDINKLSEVNIIKNKVLTKSPEINKTNKVFSIKAIDKPQTSNVNVVPGNKVTTPSETNNAGKISEINVKNVVSDAKIVKTVETSIASKTPETKVSKLPESSVTSKTSENKITNKLLERDIQSKNLEIKAINKSSETSNNSSVIDVNTVSETGVASKASEKKNITKESEIDSVSSKEVVESKYANSKATVVKTKVGDKINEFQKAQSPPKDFRTVRRTSDVIAARIQNIFSNISTPEKPPPLLSKKSKVFGKSNANSDLNSVKTTESNTDFSNVEVQPVIQQSDAKLIVDSKKNEIKLSAEIKSSEISTPKETTKQFSAVVKEEKNDTKCAPGDSNKEYKHKEKASSVADHSSLKKENKLVSESNNASQSCKAVDVVSAPKVKTEEQLEKADSKTEYSINSTPSKAQDKKNLNIGGKMPIKKDLKSLDGTASLKTTNEDDRKSLDSTTPLKTGLENTTKELIMKNESSNTYAGSGDKVSKSVLSSNSLNTSINSSVSLKNNFNVSKKIDSVSVKELSSVRSTTVLPTIIDAKTTQSSGNSSRAGEILQSPINSIKKTSYKIVSSSVETTQATQIEVAKITPSTVSNTVPTVNVLFRTKSPQGSATKEENRKKVVVETYASTSPIPSPVINATKVSEKNSVKSSSSVCESVQEAFKTVESVQKSLNSPRLTSKHSIVNLKKEELATATLSTPESSENKVKMAPSSVKINDKCSVDDSKSESFSGDKSRILTPVPLEMDKATAASGIASTNSDSIVKVSSNISPGSEISEFRARCNEISAVSETDITSLNTAFDQDKSYLFETKTSVVDLSDWSKKFQRVDPEPPRVPVRRRTFRESLPPALPVRSRFGSLKRIDDSPRYIPRSPSQSSLPQRYSYTEMLSKVCSMGVLPFSESLSAKSLSSSSSQVSELWSELSEEQSTATHTSEMLENETTERMRLEKEVQELQNRCSQVQLRSDKMEMEMMEARVYRTPELNGDLSEDEDIEANSSLYKQKYERAVRDMEIMKRRIQQQHEEEIEQKAMMKKASDKRLAEALEDVEEERQVANQWKRKAQKLGSELQDLRLMLEEQMARNGELEKKQRRFDAELSAAQEEIKKERLLREKFAREKDQALHEKYSIEQDLQSSKLDTDTLHEKINQLNRELDELTLSSKGEEEVTQLKRAKQELERKSRDQEEELEELAAQVSMLEQAKLRLEMSLEKVRQEHRREASVREEEIEEIRASFSKKIKNLEAQLETEQDERHQLMKQKHELERRLYELADQPPPQDPEIERRLRRDLKRTKALLRDAQSMLEHTREGQSGKTLIRQLKNQLEDSEFAKAAAVKARQAVEAELHECQTQLEEATRVKNEVESRCLQLSREKSAIQTQLEEAEEEMAEVMKKYKAVVAQMSIDQKTLTEQNQQIADLETEKQMLKDQLSEVSHKFEHLAGQSEDTHKVHRLDGKVRDLESKLELEQTTRSRLEHQIARLKEQNERAREECDSLRNKENQAQEGVRRLQRQIRDLREDYSALQQKEAEAYRKQHELEMALENTETDLQVTKNDLRLACQRIQDLQNALEDDLDSGTDVPDDSGSDSDDSFELSVLRNQSVTPTQRCDSAASNYSLASEGFRSRTSSFSHELSAFSSRNDAESKDHNGLSGVNTSSHMLDVEHNEAV